MASNKYEEKYTKPELREKLKEEIKASDKGGKPGQWSARKSQLLVQEYEKHGGDYKKSHKDQSARSLEAWTEQDWQTLEGHGEARENGNTKRYLPKKVWEKLSDQEKKEAERTKTRASKEGKQFVPWTPAIKKAFEDANIATDKLQIEDEEYSREELYDEAQELDISGRSQMRKEDLQQAVHKARERKLENLNQDELYEMAKHHKIDGRSNMNKKELIEVLIDL